RADVVERLDEPFAGQIETDPLVARAYAGPLQVEDEGAVDGFLRRPVRAIIHFAVALVHRLALVVRMLDPGPVRGAILLDAAFRPHQLVLHPEDSVEVGVDVL